MVSVPIWDSKTYLIISDIHLNVVDKEMMITYQYCLHVESST